jgi:hypothetical protein
MILNGPGIKALATVDQRLISLDERSDVPLSRRTAAEPHQPAKERLSCRTGRNFGKPVELELKLASSISRVVA